jgi:hypothetical protein
MLRSMLLRPVAYDVEQGSATNDARGKGVGIDRSRRDVRRGSEDVK